MALIQISEPGMSPEPHQARLAVGIDLGTTNTVVASRRVLEHVRNAWDLSLIHI